MRHGVGELFVLWTALRLLRPAHAAWRRGLRAFLPGGRRRATLRCWNSHACYGQLRLRVLFITLTFSLLLIGRCYCVALGGAAAFSGFRGNRQPHPSHPLCRTYLLPFLYLPSPH